MCREDQAELVLSLLKSLWGSNSVIDTEATIPFVHLGLLPSHHVVMGWPLRTFNTFTLCLCKSPEKGGPP